MYHLKDRSSEDLLLFTEGSKWYLGRLSEWSTYAAEQNLAGKEVVRTVLDKIYDCDNETLLGLSKLYIDDKRFTKNIDKHKDGLADFISKSIQIYCK